MSCAPLPLPPAARERAGGSAVLARETLGAKRGFTGGASVSLPCPPRSLYALPAPTLGQAHVFLSDPDSQAKVSIMEKESKKKKKKRASGDESEPFNSNLRRPAGRAAAGAAAGSKGERELPERLGVGRGEERKRGAGALSTQVFSASVQGVSLQPTAPREMQTPDPEPASLQPPAFLKPPSGAPRGVSSKAIRAQEKISSKS